MAKPKQFEFRVTGRGTLTDPTQPLTPSNLTFTIDSANFNGTNYKASSLDSTSVSAVQNAVNTIATLLYKPQQTLTLTTASVANGQTVTITIGSYKVTYTNSSGSSVTQASGALATALKAACDANAPFAYEYNTAVSGNNLVITAIYATKSATMVLGGTGFSGWTYTIS
jgi:hypothetical protein